MEKFNFKKLDAPYASFRFNKLNTPEFRHLWLLVFWPLYGIMFMSVERFIIFDSYHDMYCALDDMIPFMEIFFIPYMYWFVYLVGMYLFTLAYDTECFRKLMWFTIFTYTAAIIVYLLYPTEQNLRPEIVRDNFLSNFIAEFYQFDTNTNVNPSIHVMGSLGIMFASYHCKHFRRMWIKIMFTVICVLICASTMFMKQHSVLDIPLALVLSAVAYVVAFHVMPRISRRRAERRTSAQEEKDEEKEPAYK